MPSAASVGIVLDGKTAGDLSRALRVLGETDAPHLRAGLQEGGELLASATRSRAVGGIASGVRFAGVKGKSWGLRATVTVDHPGAKPMEFGRKWYYRNFRVENRRATRSAIFRTKDGRVSARLKASAVRASKGERFQSNPGQKARPFVGIVKEGAAIGAVGPEVRVILERAIAQEWDRIGQGGA